MICNKFENMQSIAILAGAGISIDAPSKQMSGLAFCNYIIEQTINSQSRVRIDPELIFNLPKFRKHRPGEYIRFEQLLMFAQQTIDPQLSLLSPLNSVSKPNDCHAELAKLISAGAVVITTNFDTLIETAYSRIFENKFGPLRVFDAPEDFSADVENITSIPSLWKIHGSISSDGRVDTVRATIDSILSDVGSGKQEFLRSICKNKDLIAVGYSGSDDLDIVETIAETKSEKIFCFVQHAPQAPVIKEFSNEIMGKKISSFDVTGISRIYLNQDYNGKMVRSPKKLLYVEGITRDFLMSINNSLPKNPIIPQKFEGCSNGSPEYDRKKPNLGYNYPNLVEFCDRLFSLDLFNRPTDVKHRNYLSSVTKGIEHTEIQTIYRKSNDFKADSFVSKLESNFTGVLSPNCIKKISKFMSQPNTSDWHRLVCLNTLQYHYYNVLDHRKCGEIAYECLQLALRMKNYDQLLQSLDLVCGLAEQHDNARFFGERRALTEFHEQKHTEYGSLLSLSLEMMKEAELKGNYPNIWKKKLSQNFISDGVKDRFNFSIEDAFNAHRFSINVGDVKGEAQMGRLIVQQFCEEIGDELALDLSIRSVELERYFYEMRGKGCNNSENVGIQNDSERAFWSKRGISAQSFDSRRIEILESLWNMPEGG